MKRPPLKMDRLGAGRKMYRIGGKLYAYGGAGEQHNSPGVTFDDENPDNFVHGYQEPTLQTSATSPQPEGSDYWGEYDTTKPVGKPARSLASKLKGTNLNGVAPYISNIVNTFKQLPEPPTPVQENYINPNLVDYGADRSKIQNDLAGFNRETDYKVSGRTLAQGLKAKALAGVTQGLGNIAQQEGNTNAQIKNQTAQFNQSTQARNVERQSAYNQELLAKSLKQQELNSENLADFGNKFQMARRDKNLMDLEGRRIGILSKAYENGTYGRNLSAEDKKAKEELNGGDFAFGGSTGPGYSVVPWSKQGVNSADTLSRGTMYKMPYSLASKLYKTPTPVGSKPTDDFYVTTGPGQESPGDALQRLTRPNVDFHGVTGNKLPHDNMGAVASDFKYGGLDMSEVLVGTDYENHLPSLYKHGGIYIKPSHRGRFTAWKARTGETTAQALHSSSPHVRQMANFARNAKKWHHKFGGERMEGWDQELENAGRAGNLTLLGYR